MSDKIILKWLRLNVVVVMGVVLDEPRYTEFVFKKGARKGQLGHRMLIRMGLNKTHGRPKTVALVAWGAVARKAAQASIKKGTVLIVSGELDSRKFRSDGFYEPYIRPKSMQVVRQAVPSNCRLVHKSIWDDLDPLQREIGEMAALALFGEDIEDAGQSNPPESDD